MTAITIAIIISDNGNEYFQRFDISDDSVILIDKHECLLLHYDNHCIVRNPDNSIYGRFQTEGDKWVFVKENEDNYHNWIFGNSTMEPDGLIDFEVEISKMYINNLKTNQQ